PNLATVIPAIDHVDKYLTEKQEDKSLTTAVKSALLLGKKTLNRYYSLTDSSDVYRIAMVLHPRHKLQYFETTSWERDWIATAEEIVTDEYKGSYSDIEVEIPGMDESNEQEISTTGKKKESKNIFDHLPALAAPEQMAISTHDELVRYLAADVEHTPDVLAWWHEHRTTYPRLSQMAFDYLSIPATSVDVERTFSRGHPSGNRFSYDRRCTPM
ncbi:hypothetical protein M378DRAFT_83694, partial [Amanita muscaria Koide BX008]